MTTYNITIKPEPFRHNPFTVPGVDQELQVVWEWEVRPVIYIGDDMTTTDKVVGFGASSTEDKARQAAEKWADALGKRVSYNYVPE